MAVQECVPSRGTKSKHLAAHTNLAAHTIEPQAHERATWATGEKYDTAADPDDRELCLVIGTKK